MARKQRSSAAPANGAKGASSAPATTEDIVQQQVLRHYAKTVYFNDLWKSFLSNISGLIVLMSVVVLQKMRQSESGLGFVAGFEVLSLLIAVCTILFVKRSWKPVLAFKAAFLLALLQTAWYGHTYYRRQTRQDLAVGDLLPDQFAFGSLYFLFCWVSDRFMLRSQEMARRNAEELQTVLEKKAT